MNSIRHAEARDIPRILELLEQVDMVHHRIRPDIFKGPATKYDEAQLREMLGRRSEMPIFVCTDACDRVLGYAMCQIKQVPDDNVLTPIKTLYVDDLCVDGACRGQHIGHELFEHVKEYAAGIGCYNLTLNVWAGNDGALTFYEACGMKPQKYGMEVIL